MYRYTLEKGSRKHVCPSCGKRTFVRYVDTETGAYLDERFGRCDREVKCGYFVKPKGNKRTAPAASSAPYVPPTPVPFPWGVYEAHTSPNAGSLFWALEGLGFDPFDLAHVLAMYRVRSFKEYTCFPFIDIKGTLWAVQCKQFDKGAHTKKTTFLHPYVPVPDAYHAQDKKIRCLFGAHLLKKNTKPIMLVEAPKTAIIGACVLPQYLWLAVYNKSSLTLDKLSCLKGRRVFVCPDLGAFEDWQKRIKELLPVLGGRWVFIEYLEIFADEAARAKGLDIADFFKGQFSTAEPDY
jgi:predicted RNA-binding Zn-ribbon protein involved in translation (DUF1610 family)